jgi:putative SOS response-associated peptidase YedK
MDQQGRPNEPHFVYRRHPETGLPVEGRLLWGLIPHFLERRPDFAPIHARAETVADNEWFGDAYRKRRCVVPMNSFFQKDDGGKRHAISRRDGEPFGVAGIWENWKDPRAGNGSARSLSSPFRPTSLSRRSTIARRPSSKGRTFRGGSATMQIRETCLSPTLPTHSS